MKEVVEEIKSGTVIIDRQPEFKAEVKNNVSATYFILLENEKYFNGKEICDYKICGVSVANWVARACESKPVFLRVNAGDDIISLIRPYAKGTDYSVVLYANTPLLSKNHLRDLLEYVSIKRLNVVKLAKGFVLSNEHISRADEIFSVDTYDFSTNDFFEVSDLDDLELAQKEIFARLIKFHHKNGVVFENANSSYVDATCKLGANSWIGAGVSITENSVIDEECSVGQNSMIKNSILGKNVKVGSGVCIFGSVIKDNTVIEDGAVIKSSVVGKDCYVGDCTKILSSGIKDGVNIGEGGEINCARIASGVKVGMNCKVLGDINPAVILAGAVIKNNADVVAINVSENEVVENDVTENNQAILHENLAEVKDHAASDEGVAEMDKVSDTCLETGEAEQAGDEGAKVDEAHENVNGENAFSLNFDDYDDEDDLTYDEEEEDDDLSSGINWEEFDENDNYKSEESASYEENGEFESEPEPEFQVTEEEQDEVLGKVDERFDVPEDENGDETEEEPMQAEEVGEYEVEEPGYEEAEENSGQVEPENEPEEIGEYDGKESEEEQEETEPENEVDEEFETVEEPENEVDEALDLDYSHDFESEDEETTELDVETFDEEAADEDRRDFDEETTEVGGEENEFESRGNFDEGNEVEGEQVATDHLHYWDSYDGKESFKEDFAVEEKEELPHYWQDEYNGLNDEESVATKYVKPLYWQDEDDKD